MHLLRFLLFGLQSAAIAAAAAVDLAARSVASDIQSLAPASSVAVQLRERWSEVGAPVATVVFNATSEKEISDVVCGPALVTRPNSTTTCQSAPSYLLY